MSKKLPIYDAVFKDEDTLCRSEDGGISVISLVEKPAIESDFMKFEEDEQKVIKTNILDDEQRVIVGAVLVPDRLIYRNTERGEFFIRFSEAVIKNMHLNMMRTKAFSYFSIAHNGETLQEWKITPLEIWRKEFEEDKSNAYGFDLPVGTLFISAKIEDEQIWERIKANEINGFSIEAILDYQYSNMEKFLFNKIEKGEKVVLQSEKGVEFGYTGEFVEGEQTVVVKDGVIEEVKPVAEPQVEDPKTEPEAEPAKEPETEPKAEPEAKQTVEQLLERIEKFEASLTAISEQFASQLKEKEEELSASLLKQEELKLAAHQSEEAPNAIVKEETKMSRVEIIEKLGTVKY